MATNALMTVLARIYSTIPRPILELAFAEGGSGPDISLDERIKTEIILGRVLPELNTTCGKPKSIELLPTYIETSIDVRTQFLGPMSSGVLYRVPYAAREGRDIVEVRDLTYSYAYNNAYYGMDSNNMGGGNNLMSMSRGVLASHTLENGAVAPTAMLRDGNIIQITPNVIGSGCIANCILGYDSEFTNIPGGGINPLATYVVAILKGYIYNKLVIELDQGALVGGAQLGRIRDIVDRYEQEGSDEVQKEALEAMRGSAIYDPEVFRQLISAAL